MDERRRAPVWRPVRSGVSALVDIVRDTYISWYQDRAIRLGAGLAYYALFAIIPTLTLAVWFASMFVARSDVEAALDDVFSQILDGASASASASIAAELDRTITRSGLGILGAGSLIVAATLLFVALQDAFNMIWAVPLERGVGITVRRRLLSFVVVLLLGAYLVGAVVISTTTGLIENLLPSDVGLLDRLSPFIEASTSWATGVLALAIIFRLLAPVRLAWRHVFIGGAATAVLVVVGTQLLGIYLNRTATASISGAAGAVGLFLVWLYYEAQIVLVGAELTKVLSSRAEGRGTRDGRRPAPPG